MWLGLKQLKRSRNFWTCSRRSFTFLDLNFSQVQMGVVRLWRYIRNSWVYSTLQLLKQMYSSSAYHGLKTNFVKRRVCLCQQVLNNYCFGCKPLFTNNQLPLSSRRSCKYCNHCSLSCGENFLVIELSPASSSRSDLYPSWVKVCTTFVITFANFTMLVESSCRIGGWLCISLNWALTITSDLPHFSQSISKHDSMNPIPDNAAFAWPVRLVFRYIIFSVSLIGFWWTTTSKKSDHSGHSRGPPEDSVSFSFGKTLAPLLDTGW